MEKEECWNTFARTGLVEDYLKYARADRSDGSAPEKEERGQREGTSDGDGAIGRYHW